MSSPKFRGSFEVAESMHEIVWRTAGSYIEAAVKKNDGKHTNMELVVMYCWVTATVAVFFTRFGVIDEDQNVAYLKSEEGFVFDLLSANSSRSTNPKSFEEFSDEFWDLMGRLFEKVDLILEKFAENRENFDSNAECVKAFFDESYEDFVLPENSQMGQSLVSLFILILIPETIDASMKELNKHLESSLAKNGSSPRGASTVC
jgi:hypothetical protein